MAEIWTTDEVNRLHDEVFAPWIRALGLRAVAVEPERVHFVMPSIGHSCGIQY